MCKLDHGLSVFDQGLKLIGGALAANTVFASFYHIFYFLDHAISINVAPHDSFHSW